MTADEWRAVLEDLRALGGLTVALTGGEPLAHPQFFDIARSARRLRLAIRVFTNASLVDASTASEIAALHPMAVEVSMHGATADVHDAATGRPGSFQDLVRGLEHLRRAGIRILLKTPLTRLNEHQVDEMIAFAASAGLRYQLDATLTPRDDGDRGPLAYAASSGAVLRVMRMQAIARNLGPVERRKGNANCGLARITLAVDPDGNVYPCHQWRQRSLGNVREVRLRDLWPSSPARLEAASVAVAANDAILERGGALSTFDYCPALAFQETGDPLVPDADVQRRAALAARAFQESL
jgi:MoaA/NifB/PqqE/SkfB family radical SAM enzyme